MEFWKDKKSRFPNWSRGLLDIRESALCTLGLCLWHDRKSQHLAWCLKWISPKGWRFWKLTIHSKLTTQMNRRLRRASFKFTKPGSAFVCVTETFTPLKKLWVSLFGASRQLTISTFALRANSPYSFWRFAPTHHYHICASRKLTNIFLALRAVVRMFCTALRAVLTTISKNSPTRKPRFWSI